MFLIYIFGFEQNVPSYCESFIEEAVLEEFVESDGDDGDYDGYAGDDGDGSKHPLCIFQKCWGRLC